MARVSSEPAHVGDYEFACPGCGDLIAVPVMVEQVDADTPGSLALRATPNVDVVYEHVRRRHALSRRR